MKSKITRFISVFIAALVFSGAVEAAPKAKKSKQPKHQIAFSQADNGDGFLTVFEFAKTQGPGTPLVEVRSRFLPIDTSGSFEVVIDPTTGLPALDPVTGQPVLGNPLPDGLVSLAEWETYIAGKKKLKSKLSRFDLADFDGDGQLDPVEFGYLVSPMVKMENVITQFETADISDDGFISETEFNSSYSL